MSFQRDLAWQHINSVYQSSMTHQFARYALGLDYTMIPKDALHQAKRSLLDALGCAIGAYDSPGRSICETAVQVLHGPEEATVFGSGIRTSALNATMINSFLVRFLDYNDIGGGGHNSDSIPSILAVSEREKINGRDFLTSVVISYELGARVREAVIGTSLVERGWNFDIRGGLTVPPAIGRLMGLNEEQIANAIGICASHSLPLGVLDAHKEENTMSKNLRFGFVAYNAILSCILAKQGFTGPLRVVEGDSGFRQVVLQGDMDLEHMIDFSGWRILKTRHKCLCANTGTIGHVLATLAIVRENDLRPEDIAAVRVKANLHESRHTTTLSKKYANNAETADHSAFYSTATAIKERSFGPKSFKPENFTDPVILDLIEKITVEYDPDMIYPQGGSEITTKDGRKFEKHIAIPHGLGNDPLTDQELEGKFREMALDYMEEQQIQRIFDTIWNLENLDQMNKLARLMVFDRENRDVTGVSDRE